MAAMLLALASCAHWQADAAAGYESTGAILAGLGSQARAMCKAGRIKPADCAVLKTGYNRARTAYIATGDALILAMDATDAAARKKDLDAYQRAASDLAILLPELVRTSDEFGIQGAKGNGQGTRNGLTLGLKPDALGLVNGGAR